MFQKIAQSFTNILQKWTNKKLTQQQISDILQDIRHALIDADTAVDATDAFIRHLEQNLDTLEMHQKIQASQQMKAWIHNSLVTTLGTPPKQPIQATHTPHIIFMVGLQGAGKTTTTIKLASWIEKNLKKKVAVTSLDFQRPAAQEQLQILSTTHHISYIASVCEKHSILRTNLLQSIQAHHAEILIIDTAGRLSLDDTLMQELEDLKNTFRPDDIFYVVDSQMGQNAALTAQQFHKKLKFTASILTKCDADSKGGVALSLKTMTSTPIAFMGEGEKNDQFSIFNPERIANRMLDLGDVASLVEHMKKNIDTQDAMRQSQKMAQGLYDLEDFLSQAQQLQAMGGMQSIMGMLPGMQNIPEHIKNIAHEDHTKSSIALIQSMTRKERRHPALLNQPSRKQRILKGSGRSKKELLDTLKQFEKMKNMIKKLSPSKMRMAMEMMAKHQKGTEHM